MISKLLPSRNSRRESMEPEILEPLELHFEDLLLLSSPPSSNPTERERLDPLSNAVMQALGPPGPGLLSITGVPRASALRRTLLPLARKLALLGNKDRARVLKEHGLGSDVSLKNLDRSVSSFAMQLKYPCLGSELASGGLKETEEGYQNGLQTRIVRLVQGVYDNEFKLLGDSLKELGYFMMELGLRLAQVCDRATGGRELEQSLMDSGTAKARLIHYHSSLDNLFLKEINCRPKGSIQKARPAAPFLSNFHGCASGSKAVPSSGRGNSDEHEIVEHLNKVNLTEPWSKKCFSKLWQQWHYDYGIFTVLTAPCFMSSSGKEKCSSVEGIQEYRSPDEHTYLQLFDTNKNKIFVVKTSPESFIIQVGEAADILSRGKLRSTLHSVGRPTELHTLSRQTFVVFLQPAWDKTLCYPGHLLDTKTASPKKLESSKGTSHFYSKSDVASSSMTGSKSYQLVQEIFRNIPPLSSRLRDGMTFAEFSRETTKQYYGGNGMQSNIY